MSAFHFPQSGELHNTTTVLVPIHTLRALLAAALAWEITTGMDLPNTLPPQIVEATNWAICELPEADSAAATQVAARLMLDRLGVGIGG